MTSNYSTIDVEGEEIVYTNETPNSIYLGLLLHYITLTNYYIVQDKIQMTSNYNTIEAEAEEIN